MTEFPLRQPELGLFLRDLRGRKGLTQVELAERSGLTQNWITKIESGKHKPELSRLDKLLTALDQYLYVEKIDPKKDWHAP